MKQYEVITDPKLPCKRIHVVSARSTTEAAKKALLFEHDGEQRSFKLDPANIGKIKRVKDRGELTHVITVVPTAKHKPANPFGGRFAWLRVEGVWFWVDCIVKAL